MSESYETPLQPSAKTEYRSRRLKHAGKFIAGVSLFAGLTTAEGLYLSSVVPTEVPFGNSTAGATLEYDGYITADMGVIGSARLAVEEPAQIGPVALGARFNVSEIAQPPSRTSESLPTEFSIDSLLADVDESTIEYYGEMYRAISRDEPQIAQELEDHTKQLIALAGGVNILALTIAASVGREGRRKLLRSPQVYLSAALLAVGVAAVQPNETAHDWQPTSHIFDGTELENVQISGGVAELLVNNIGEGVMEYIKQTDDFYSKMRNSASEELAGSWLLSDEFRNQRDVKLSLFYTDNHCNTGTPSIMAHTAEVLGITTANDGGDTVAAGTKYEEYCVKVTMEAFTNAGVRVVQSPGNHDSDITEKQLIDHGATVLQGDVVEVDGVRYLGIRDPRASRPGVPIRYMTSRTMSDVALEIKEKACQTDEPVVIMVHDREAAEEAITAGCVKIVLAGHTHNQKVIRFPLPYGGEGVVLNGGTSGGAKENELTYGKLHDPAMFIAYAQDDEGNMVGMQTFTMYPDGTFDVGRITRFDASR